MRRTTDFVTTLSVATGIALVVQRMSEGGEGWGIFGFVAIPLAALCLLASGLGTVACLVDLFRRGKEKRTLAYLGLNFCALGFSIFYWVKCL